MWSRGLDSNGLGQDPVTWCCEHSYEPSGSVKHAEFLDYLGDYQYSKYDSSLSN